MARIIGAPVTPRKLDELLKQAKEVVDKMTPEEYEKMFEAQKKSFLNGMGPCEHGNRDWETCP